MFQSLFICTGGQCDGTVVSAFVIYYTYIFTSYLRTKILENAAKQHLIFGHIHGASRPSTIGNVSR